MRFAKWMLFCKTPKPKVHIIAIRALIISVCACLWTGEADAKTTGSATWSDIEARGINQDVYFHAWGGDPQINLYIQWVAKQVKQQYQINLHHVKLTDTSEAVSRVLAEKSAGNNTQGQVDLVWINGENFAAMAKHQLLAPNWVAQLPNFSLTDPDNNPAMTRDFGVPTQWKRHGVKLR